MAKVTAINKEAIETKESEVYKIAKEIAKEKGLNPDIIGKSEDLSASEYMATFIFESLNKLSLVRATLHDEDLMELKGYKLDGTIKVIDEVFDMLDASGSLYSHTH